MRKKTYGSKDIITVYKFMDMCGLHCATVSNIHVSHEIMMKKLRLRSNKFPNKVIIPSRIPFKAITSEKVKCGSIILVEDDAGNIVAYRYPRFMIVEEEKTEEERALIRERLIAEQLEKEEVDKDQLPGYKKYLYKKNIKELEESKLNLLKELMLDQLENQEIVTEKKSRIKVLENRRRHY